MKDYKENIKVSVIIPIYNAEKYLQECLNSVFSQTLKEIEIICINDGSTDISKCILETYKEKHHNMHVVNIENQGAWNARNIGLSLAKGEKCCFIDSDDIYPSSDVLAYLYRNINEKQVYICGGSAVLLDEKGLHNMAEAEYYFSTDGYVAYEEYQWSYGFWRFMYDRQFLIKNGIKFPSYSTYEDPPFMVKAMVAARKFYACNKISYVYRKYERKVDYTYEMTRDCLCSMLEVLHIAEREELDKLAEWTLEHINTWLCKPLLYQITKGHKEILKLLQDVQNISLCTLEVEKKMELYNCRKDEEKFFLDKVGKYPVIIIYGLGFVGKKLGDYLLEKNSGSKKIYALSSTNEIFEYKGIKVYQIDSLLKYRKSALVIIATKKNLHFEIFDILQKLGFKNIEKLNFEVFEIFSDNNLC